MLSPSPSLALWPLTLNLLEETRIGVQLSQLRKRTDHPRVRAEASQLLAQWKTIVARQQEAPKVVGPSRHVDAQSRACRLLMDALRVDAGSRNEGDTRDDEVLALQIHEALLRHVGASSSIETMDATAKPLYRAGMLKLASALKHPGNTDLRQRVRTCVLHSDDLVKMSAEELAPPCVKAEKERHALAEKDAMKQMMQRRNGVYNTTQPCVNCGEFKCITYGTQSCGAVWAPDDAVPDAIYHCSNCGHQFSM